MVISYIFVGVGIETKRFQDSSRQLRDQNFLISWEILAGKPTCLEGCFNFSEIRILSGRNCFFIGIASYSKGSVSLDSTASPRMAVPASLPERAS